MLHSLRLVLASIILCLMTPTLLLACLWDYDTVQMERQRFPSTLELITGKFLRHTPEFYEWRIQDRLRKLHQEHDNLAYMDDLAVAYDKTAQHDKAIEVMLSARAKKPDRYETEANLGTFYIHAGQPEKGLPHIDAALRINPDAHFGREKYQKALVEYVLLRRKEGDSSLPLGSESKNFHTHLLPAGQGFRRLAGSEAQAALKGILGMLRFGHHDSPVLLEALGDILCSPVRPDHANLLAARAYLKASYEVKGAKACAGYRELALQVIHFHMGVTLKSVEEEFLGELSEAQEWYAQLRENELRWIRDGLDPEEMFARTYYREPEISWPVMSWEGGLAWLTVGLVVVGCGCLAVFGYRRRRRLAHRTLKQAPTAAPACLTPTTPARNTW
jgi:tetratricopeptide (TPR) repeat protein